METILILDDYPPLLRLYAKELEKEGYQVVAVQNLAEAIRHIQNEPFAAVLVEIGVLYQEEFERLVQELAQRGKVPIVIHTGELGRHAAEWDESIAAWVTKSSDLSPLKKMLKALAGKEPITGLLCAACRFYEPLNGHLGRCLLTGQLAWPKWMACEDFLSKTPPVAEPVAEDAHDSRPADRPEVRYATGS